MTDDEFRLLCVRWRPRAGVLLLILTGLLWWQGTGGMWNW